MAEAKGTDQPITRHPLFPAIVALWFGALAGLGSVIVSSSTIEGIVLALGIDKVIPMAAPPLGTTMRILLALGMTGVGAAVGGLIARRIARPAAPVEGAAQDVGGAEATNEAAPVESAQPARRRRALAIEPEAAPAVREAAPVPGDTDDARILNVADFDIDSFDEAPAADVPFRRFAETSAAPASAVDEDENLPAWLDTESAWHEADPAPAVRGVFTTPPGAQIFQVELDAAEKAASEKASENPEAPAGSRLFEAYSRELSPRDADEGEDGAHPGFSLLPRLPQGDWAAEEPAVSEEPAAADDTVWDRPVPPFAAPAAEHAAFEDDTAEHHEVQAVATPVEPAPVEYAPFEIRSAADRIVDADLGTLSQVELLERLALAMQRRREEARHAAEQAALIPESVVAPFAAPVIEQAPLADHDASHDGATPGWPAAVPEAMRPIALAPIESEPHFSEDAGHNDDEVQGYLPPRHLGLSGAEATPFPASPFSGEAEDEGDDPVLQQGYSSLLNLSRNNAVRKPFLQFGEADEAGDEIAHATPAIAEDENEDEHGADRQPAFGRPVLLPDPVGEAPPALEERPFDAPRNDPDATEKALRAALATLQRMSGAA
ncbi:hypothetical protein [Novosphingobium gossypii]|uniref:hypothetical protein n=1 Tax=Novosphingobium gossypii TaxID=1604774 RepID=UPI003D217F74